ncbi:MAG: DUF1428 domain-containing protein [Erythrobacter sp.]
MTFIDGFVIAVPTANREQYLRHCEHANGWFLEQGALRVVESWGEDVPSGDVTDFRRAVAADEEETVCMGWIEWPDRSTRDAAMALMQDGPPDERFDPDKNPMPFDGKRMIFGGFAAIYDKSGSAVS